MLYAKVVVGLPVEGAFDYLVPAGLSVKIKAGSRVRIAFGSRRIIGYVVRLAGKTDIARVKPVLEVIDEAPLLDKGLLSLTKKVSDYYCCSWGEAIETTLPQGIRRGKRSSAIPSCPDLEKNPKNNLTLVHLPDENLRWKIYLEGLKGAVEKNKSAIVLLPDMQSLSGAKKRIFAELGITPMVLYRRQATEIRDWEAISQGKSGVAVGIRSVIFAPFKDLGLIIIEQEENFVYKQDQVPHYHAREVAFMRAEIEGAGVILGSAAPSLEAAYLAGKNKVKYLCSDGKIDFPEVKIVDTRNFYGRFGRKKRFFSKFLEDAVYSALDSKGKVLLFLNRKGFATLASCLNCGVRLTCPRCNINLVYHFDAGILSCHYCNFKMPAPKICPNCNSGYIKYAGSGTETIESQLSAIFPSAAIKRIEKDQRPDLNAADIFVATSAATKQARADFALVGVLAIDNSLNHADLRSSERVFAMLTALSRLAKKKLIIQTAMPLHHCFQALLKKDPNLFYETELKQRKELYFPPYRHMILVKVRGRDEEKTKEAAASLFERLAKAKKKRDLKVLSVNPGSRPKLRDNFYRQILISCANVKKAVEFLKFNLKDFSRSSIIVTVDVDPL